MSGARPRFPTLFSPIRLGALEVRNRIASSGHATRLTDGYTVGDRLVAYHEARARGGAGLVVAEVASVDPRSVYSASQLLCSDDACIEGYAKLVRAMHAHGCAVFGQVFHGGLETPTAPDGTRAVAWGPSAVASERYHTAPRAMPHVIVRELVGLFGDGAARMHRAGLDGVEMVASHGYLLAQFLNPHINRRTDEYGGSFENRLRFIREIAETIRGRIGTGRVLGMRISGDEMSEDGLDLETVAAICAALDGQGLFDYFNITSGASRQIDAAIYIVPPMATGMAVAAPLAAEIKARVGVPVMAVGRINHAAQAEQVLATGQADMCGMTRAMICDPEMANKAWAGALEDVRLCIACNQACIDHMHRGFAISCIQHPETGRELVFGTRESAARRKTVLVAGGGPGGMKAAAVAAERGHRVVLHEKAARLGGQALLAQLLPGRAEFGGIVSNLAREMEIAGVDVSLASAVDRALVEALAPDAVVIATGATVRRPPIEGIAEGHVVDAWQVLQDHANTGARVVIADWRCDWVGLGIAEKLARDGCHVRLASTGYVAGELIPKYVRDRWVGELHRLGVEFVPFVRLHGVDAETVYFQHMASGEAVLLEGVDTLVLAQGHDADTRLERELDGLDMEIHLVGDCLAARSAEEAVLEGLKAGSAL